MISKTKWMLMALAVTTLLYVLNSHSYLSKNPYQIKKLRKLHIPGPVITGSPSLKSPLVMVVCNPHENSTYKFGRFNERSSENKSMTKDSLMRELEEELIKLRKSWLRQAQQVSTMLKSLLYFSKSPKWRIVVITDTPRTFQRVVNLTKEFPEVQQQRLILERQPLWLPPQYPELLNHWRPCAWTKQFLAEALPNEDAVIYVDSDLVFLGPPEELWWLLDSMGPQQILTLAPEPFYKMEENQRAYAGQAGLNTGVMAINLTRARQLSRGGLGSEILGAGPIEPSPRHDQDALNHFLHDKPQLYSEVTSRWNFIPSSCMKAAPPCPDCHSAGIIVFHGADMSFYRSIDAKFNVVYSLLVQESLEADPEILYAKLSGQLAFTDTITLPYPCNNYSNINEALTLRLADMAIDSAIAKGETNGNDGR